MQYFHVARNRSKIVAPKIFKNITRLDEPIGLFDWTAASQLREGFPYFSGCFRISLLDLAARSRRKFHTANRKHSGTDQVYVA